MFTRKQLDEMHQVIFERMLKAGWMKEFKYTDGKGWHLTWTQLGMERSVPLQRICETYRLDNGDAYPLVFSKLAHGEALPAGFALTAQPEPFLLNFFKDCVDELGIHDDEDMLIVLVSALNGWAPVEEARALGLID